MAPRLAVLGFAVVAAVASAGAPAYATQICHSVRVDLINDWVYCLNVVQNPDGSVTVGVDCDMAQNPCPDPSVTVP